MCIYKYIDVSIYLYISRYCSNELIYIYICYQRHARCTNPLQTVKNIHAHFHCRIRVRSLGKMILNQLQWGKSGPIRLACCMRTAGWMDPNYCHMLSSHQPGREGERTLSKPVPNLPRLAHPCSEPACQVPWWTLWEIKDVCSRDLQKYIIEYRAQGCQIIFVYAIYLSIYLTISIYIFLHLSLHF